MFLHRTNFWNDTVVKNVNKSIRSLLLSSHVGISHWVWVHMSALEAAPLRSQSLISFRQNMRKDVSRFERKRALQVFPRHSAPAFTDTNLTCSSTISCDYTLLFSHFTSELHICLKLIWTGNFNMRFSRLWKCRFRSYWRSVGSYQRSEEDCCLHLQGRIKLTQ